MKGKTAVAERFQKRSQAARKSTSAGQDFPLVPFL